MSTPVRRYLQGRLHRHQGLLQNAIDSQATWLVCKKNMKARVSEKFAVTIWLQMHKDIQCFVRGKFL